MANPTPRKSRIRASVLFAALGVLCLALPIRLAIASSGQSRRPYSYCRFSHVNFTQPHDVMGANAPDLVDGDAHYRDCSLGRMAAYHIGYFRYSMEWRRVELARGVFDFSFYDALVRKLAQHHVSYLPILVYPPAFRTSAPRRGARRGIYPPTRISDYVHFVRLAVARYMPGGMFWRENPALPKYPIRAWQIWNEPSLHAYWEPRPDLARYTRMLRASYTAIKRIDRHATVVAAGVPWCSDICALPYFRAIFRYGARGFFDALAIHPYAPTGTESFQRVGAVRRLLNSYGLRRIPLWVTEFGWSITGPPSPYRAGRQQAPYTATFLHDLIKHRRGLGVQEIFYWSWRDYPPHPPPSTDYWGLHTGLYDASGRPRKVAGIVSAAGAVLNG